MKKFLPFFTIILFLISFNTALAAYSYVKPPKISNINTSNVSITLYIKGTINQSVQVVFDNGDKSANLCLGEIINPGYGGPFVETSCVSAKKDKIYKVKLVKPGTQEKIQDLPSVSTSTKTNQTSTTTQPKTPINQNNQQPDQTPKADQNNQQIKKDDAVVINADKSKQVSDPPKESVYKFLAPLGDGFKCMSDSGKDENGKEGECVKGGIGSYLNTIFILIIGLAGVLSVVMIIVHSIQYMGDESVFGKTEAKAGIKSAIFGLFIALGAYALLNTINPSLTGKDGVVVDGVEVSIEAIEIEAPEAGDITELSVGNKPLPTVGGTTNCSEKGKAFCMFGNYDNPKPTGEIPSLISFIKNNPNYTIDHIIIYVSNDRIFFVVKNGSQEKLFSTTGFGHGRNGWTEEGKGLPSSKLTELRTPKGNWKIAFKRKVDNQNQFVKSKPKGFSLGGAAFTLNVGNRGIAIHGNNKNGKGSSAGCVLMSNDDILAIFPYIKEGTPVLIK